MMLLNILCKKYETFYNSKYYKQFRRQLKQYELFEYHKLI